MTTPATNPFPLRQVLPVVAITALLMLSVSSSIEWYSANVSLPRYCADPQQALHYLESNLRDQRPAGDVPRKPYLIAAKLLFLVPRTSEESIPDYLDRVELKLLEHCR
ncbi:MAG: hypothetical protein HOD58_07150 [Gammaproteobacteria bacterium]|nr:hypothetical protein [Gammaproteobacteria bacterium]